MVLWRYKSNLWLLLHRPWAFARVYRVALLVALLGALADGGSTYSALARWGVEAEQHPAVRLTAMLFGVHAGVPLAMITKLAVAIVVAATFRPSCRLILIGFGLMSLLGGILNTFYEELVVVFPWML